MAEEIPFPIADWNGNALDNENIYEGGQESEEQMEVSEADLLKRKGKRMTTLKKKAKLRKKCCHHFEKVYLNWYARLKKGMRKTPIHSKKLSCLLSKKLTKFQAGVMGCYRKFCFHLEGKPFKQ